MCSICRNTGTLIIRSVKWSVLFEVHGIRVCSPPELRGSGDTAAGTSAGEDTERRRGSGSMLCL